jgi:hypothetical protein
VKTTHTPGPWTFSGITGDDWIMARVAGKAVTVARVFEHNSTMGFDNCPDVETAAANKALITSAPDLLEALEAIVANPDMADGEEPRRLIAEARDAIAKATGIEVGK